MGIYHPSLKVAAVDDLVDILAAFVLRIATAAMVVVYNRGYCEGWFNFYFFIFTCWFIV